MRCTAYCTAGSYSIEKLFTALKDRFAVTLYRDAIHLSHNNENEDVFFFSYGVLICWGLSEEAEQKILDRVKSVETEPVSAIEIDKYDFTYGELPKIQRDKIVLANRDVITKLAVSYGLAQSSKLAIFENTIDHTISTTRQLPKDLAEKGKISLSRKQISKKIGALFLDRSSVNLHSDILDEPDFFWEYPEHHLLYQDIFKCLDLGPRVEVLNTRLNLLGELLEILNDQLNHQHSSTLEWTIIWLIVIEVTLAISHDLLHII